MARDCFIAPNDEWVLVQFDYKQIEIRIAAMLSQDDVMIDIIRSGADFHQKTAELVSKIAWGIAPEKVTELHREQAKTVNFAVLYGTTARTLAAQWGVTQEVAERVIDAILGRFKKLAAWKEAQLQEVRRTGISRAWWDGQFGRRRPLWRIADPDDGV